MLFAPPGTELDLNFVAALVGAQPDIARYFVILM